MSAELVAKDPQRQKLQRLVDLLHQSALFILLLGSNVAQRVCFKYMGYSLSAYPFFVLLLISGAFVPIFAVICTVIVVITGGFLPETRTWRFLGVYAVIGCCNALQGAGMVFANPYVPGYLQSLFQQAVIPFTFMLSLITLRSSFSWQQYMGVTLIILGLCAQLTPGFGPAGDAADPEPAANSHAGWSLLFLLAQLPVAFAAVVQERAFATVSVNVFYMMFWASVSQFLVLVCLAPLYALHQARCVDGAAAAMDGNGRQWYGEKGSCSTEVALQQLADGMADGWELASREGAGDALFGCVVTMLTAQLAQAFMVKISSAAFAVLCLAFVVPGSAAAFATPLVMGSHVEHLSVGAGLALVFVFLGISFYRLGSIPSSECEDGLPTSRDLSEELLETPDRQTSPGTPDSKAARRGPPMCSGGTGIIQSEYSNARNSGFAIWEERTLRETRSCRRSLSDPN